MPDKLKKGENDPFCIVEELPFGGGGQSNSNKRNSYHPGGNSSSLNKRHSNIGMWGQKMFTNGHNFEQSQEYGNTGC